HGVSQAMTNFNQALEIDPNSVEAYASIAEFCIGAQGFAPLSFKAAETKLRWATDKLMAIDSGLAIAHAAQGYIQLAFDWNPTAAERELKRAIKLDPKLVVPHIWYARYLLYTGNFTLAEQELRTALQLDSTRYGPNMFL